MFFSGQQNPSSDLAFCNTKTSVKMNSFFIVVLKRARVIGMLSTRTELVTVCKSLISLDGQGKKEA